ncbi:MAG TPA: hypothetical protein VKR06_00690 [Ktedonosporobacter sp.]|nr:hypothetical protein [Ktedonosporobacter sp.]
MSQEYQENNRRSKRAARAQRTRPVLVTAKEDEQTTQVAPTTEALAVKTGPLESEPETPQPRRRLPNFFSSVGKKETQADVDVAQARLARATRAKATTTKTATVNESVQAEKKSEVRATPAKTSQASARPASPFKTRYILGMGIYLICAQFIGILEKTYLMPLLWGKTDPALFTIFGFQVTISTVLFLATLVIILVVLARLDLIPRNLSSLGGRPQPGSTQPQRKSSQEGAGVKATPAPIKQGVKGSDDQLYQAYRANQRREKKR